MAAAYEVTADCTDDETFEFGIILFDEDGGAFPFDDYTYEYQLNGNCGPSLNLTVGSGITIDEGENLIRFTAPDGTQLRPGQYQHGFRIIETSGSKRQVFDGTVTVSEGGFR